MGRFKLVKTFSLEGIADGWGSDTFLKFNVLSSEESTALQSKLRGAGDDEDKLTEVFIEVLKSALIEGMVQLPDTEGVSPAEKDDIDFIPRGVIIEAFTAINGNRYTSPNAY